VPDQNEIPMPHVPTWNLAFKRTVIYLRVGVILHLFCLLTLTLFSWCFTNLFVTSGWQFIKNLLLSIFFFSHLFTTQLDAYSRYQNYKMVKDLFHIYGFRSLLAKPYSRSKCQRDSVLEAATQLGLRNTAKLYFRNSGYRWYHIIPSVLIEDPFLLFSKGYWQTTLFVPKYTSKYFLW
jgi:hypothetical protein